MTKLKAGLSIFVGIVFLAGVTWMTWAFARWMINLGPQIAGPTIAAIVGFAGLIYAQWHSKTREIEQSHRPQKIAVYNEFFDILEIFLKKKDIREEVAEGELPEELRDQFWRLNRGLIVWASPPVIRAWLNFRRVASKGEDALMIMAMDEVLRAIRSDLGNSNYGMSKGDVLRVFLSNPDEMDATINKK